MTILGKLTATMISTAFHTSLDSSPALGFDFQRDGNSHFPQRNENNLKGNFCFVLKKSCKPALDRLHIFKDYLISSYYKQINSGKSQLNKATFNQVSMFISISHKVILKDFSRSLNLSQILAPDGG